MEIKKDEHYVKFLERCKEFIDSHFSQVIESNYNITESPLENFFAIAFELSCLNQCISLTLRQYELIAQMEIDKDGEIIYYEKKGLVKYRLDFVLLNLNEYANYIGDNIKTY